MVGEAGRGNAVPDGQGQREGQPQGDGPTQPAPDKRAASDKAAIKPVGRASLTEQLRALSQEGRNAKQMALFGIKRGGKAA